MSLSPTANTPPRSTVGAAISCTTGATAASPGEVDRDHRYCLTLSTLAARKIREALRKRGTPQAAIRVGVRGGGCSGYQYVIEFADQPPRADRDLVFTFPVEREGDDGDGEPESVRVLCDRKSILFLNDTTLHWEKSLMWQGFRFLNPQEKSSCGCKQSFTV